MVSLNPTERYRRTRIRSVLCALILCGTAIGVEAAGRFSLTDIGPLPGADWSDATAVNQAGQVVGNHIFESGYNRITGEYVGGSRPFLWTNGVLRVLPTPSAAHSGYAMGLNDLGDVVGESSTNLAGSFSNAVLWRGNTVQVLNELPGGQELVRARGINRAGAIVGDARSVSGRYYAVLVSSGAVTPLPEFAGTSISLAFAINDSGTIAGGGQGAMLWSNLVPHNLVSGPPGFSTGADAINSAGDAAGSTRINDSYIRHHATAWFGETAHVIPLPSGTKNSRALGINSSRQVVGFTRSSTEGVYLWYILSGDRAFLWEDGVFNDLTSLVVNGDGWTLLRAAGINDLGQIVGTGLTPNGEAHAFLLTPVPEPAIWVLMTLGVLCVLGRRGRQSPNQQSRQRLAA